jgi:hypothetical protein
MKRAGGSYNESAATAIQRDSTSRAVHSLAGRRVDRLRVPQLVVHELRLCRMVRHRQKLVDQNRSAGYRDERAPFRALVIDRQRSPPIPHHTVVVDVPDAADRVGEWKWNHASNGAKAHERDQRLHRGEQVTSRSAPSFPADYLAHTDRDRMPQWLAGSAGQRAHRDRDIGIEPHATAGTRTIPKG